MLVTFGDMLSMLQLISMLNLSGWIWCTAMLAMLAFAATSDVEQQQRPAWQASQLCASAHSSDDLW